MDWLMRFVGLLFIVELLWSMNSEAAALNDYILDYQPLQFNPSHLHEKHSRVKRTVDPYLRWSFRAYSRTFNLQLQPAKSIFADNHEVVFGNQPPRRVDTSFIYEGNLAGDPSSLAFISIRNGSISGHVNIPGHTTYYIEPARNHFKNSDFHTIIYPESRMNLDPYRHKREAQETCGSKETYNNLNKMWQPVETKKNRLKQQALWKNTSHNKYSAEANTGEPWLRQKRELIGKRTTCIMSLQADTILYKHFLDKFSETKAATEEILSLFASHINAINKIYGETTFQRTTSPSTSFSGIRFQLQRSTIMSSPSKPGYSNDNLDVSNFLDLTAEENFDEFCLVHTFTYRDFVGGTLGLAWVATPQSPNAGVCGKYGDVRDSNNRISKRSLNTGIVTLINFKQNVPPRVSQLTFAHEVGHNFGAQHDTTDVCAPYGTNQPNAANGNYIMFPSATQGNLQNNQRFSTCSKDSIAKVLETLDPKGARNYCFKESDQPFCGNQIVEGIEQCDCGSTQTCQDKCCIPSNCTLQSNRVCSPSQGPCCSLECKLDSHTKKCQDETDCAASSFCDGINATCPSPRFKENFTTFCNNYTKVCFNGECIGSVCQNINWTECFLTSSEATGPEQMCYVSCRKNVSSECISSFDQAKVKENPEFENLLQKINDLIHSTNSIGVKRPAGSPCNNYKGYCDVFSKCRNVDAEGPFKQLTDLIFNPVTLKIIRTWIEEYWYAVLLMCIAVIVTMGVFVKIFEYNTPSRDPKKRNQPPLSSRQQEASRPHHDKRGGLHSTDVPMHDRGDYGRNQGYYNQAFQGPAPNRGHQQFDRISGTNRY